MKATRYVFPVIFLVLILASCATTSKKALQQANQGSYKIITVKELSALIKTEMDILIVDTLTKKGYRKQHIPGAHPFVFPNPEMHAWDSSKTSGMSESDFKAFLGPSKHKPLVFYCWDYK